METKHGVIRGVIIDTKVYHFFLIDIACQGGMVKLS